MNTYIIEGGIGKQVAFTAIINALAKKDKEKIQPQDPRNNMVEPEFVFKQFEKIYGKKLIK